MENYPNRAERRDHLKRIKYFKNRKDLSMFEKLDIGYNNIQIGTKIHERNVEAISHRLYDQLSFEEIKIQNKLKDIKLDKTLASRYLELWASFAMWPKNKSREDYKEMKHIGKMIFKLSKTPVEPVTS